MQIERTLFIDNHYFPSVNWFKISNDYLYIGLFENERWQKMSFCNRCVLAGGNGLINLSVPVKNGRNQKALLKDVKIAYESKWQMQHWRTIVSCYNKSPFFEFYADAFRPFFEKKYTFLFELNVKIIETVLSYINDNQKIIIIKDDSAIFQKQQQLYLTPKDFQQIPGPAIYHQLFQERIGFQPNLSILDLLFMEGPASGRLLYDSH